MRRRFFRRVGRPLQRIHVNGISPLLLRSNQLLSAGEFVGAADGFEELAKEAEGRGHPRAAQLYLEAGRARILSGETTAGMVLINQGLRLIAASGRPLRLARAGQRILGELSARGLAGEAAELRDALSALGGSSAHLSHQELPAQPQRTLPIHCPDCGAPVHPDEVEWLNASTAECPYCGTPMRAE